MPGASAMYFGLDFFPLSFVSDGSYHATPPLDNFVAEDYKIARGSFSILKRAERTRVSNLLEYERKLFVHVLCTRSLELDPVLNARGGVAHDPRASAEIREKRNSSDVPC